MAWKHFFLVSFSINMAPVTATFAHTAFGLEAWLVVCSIFKGTKKLEKSLMPVLTINVGVFTCRSFSAGNMRTE
jgi:SNF family Na+-dependent transporter